MRLRDTVESKWFKVEDLPGRERGSLVVTIAKVGTSKFSDGRESVDLHFHEHPKPLGCNTTNRKRLLMIFGEDVQLHELVGNRIELYAELTQDMKGQPVWGVRIRPVPDTVQAASAGARERIAAARQAVENRPAQGHRPRQEAPARPVQGAQEPAGFVDSQDPGFDESYEGGPF